MPETLGRYELLRLLATGGMGEVFLARVPSSGERLVVKRILRHLAKDQGFINLFFKEADLAKRLKHHNIAAVYGLSEEPPHWFMAMEFVDGISVRQMLKQGPWPIEFALEVLTQALDGADYAHRLDGPEGGILHRDLSCENILVSAAGEVKLIDFGVARAMGTNVTRVGRIKGKLAYMAPEQLRSGEVLDARVDVYSLGVVLHELLVGQRPEHVEIGYGLLPEERQTFVHRAELSKELNGILAKATHPVRDDRFENARQFHDALTALSGPPDSSRCERLGRRISELRSNSQSEFSDETLHGTEGLSSTHPMLIPILPSDQPRLRWVWISLVVLVVLLGLGAVFWFREKMQWAEPSGSIELLMPVQEDPHQDQKALVEPTAEILEAPQETAPESAPVLKNDGSVARRFGKLSFRVNPWGQIWLNGKNLGQTPLAPLEFPAGKYVFVVVNPNLRAKRKVKATVRSGRIDTVKVDFRVPR
jgi:eukaryotic-like serine/threonine-protein kinase